MSDIRWSIPAAVMLALAGGCALLQSPEAEPPPQPAEAQEPVAPVPDEIEPQPAPKEVAPVAPGAPAPEIRRLLEYFRVLKKLAGAELAREYDSARSAFARTRSDYDRVRLALLHAVPDTAYNDESRALELLEPLIRSQNAMLNDLAFLVYAFVLEQHRLEHNLQGVQEKLDALKALEKSLIERQRGGGKLK